MNNHINKIILLALLTLPNCSNICFQRKVYYPIKSGVITYKGRLDDSAYENALQQIKEFCQGEFTLIKEYTQTSRYIQPIGKSFQRYSLYPQTFVNVINDTFIEFTCQEDKKNNANLEMPKLSNESSP